jgi:hypothetical protein
MAFDQTTRNRLSRFVTDARTLLSDEFTRQLQHEFGLDPSSGEVTDLAKLGHLDDARRETAVLLRETMEHYLAGSDATGVKARREVLDRIVREQAFTVLNRLCALRMAEARGLLIESVARGYQSKGFQLYGRLAGTALGETGDAYRVYLFSIFDEFAVDLPVLFDRFSPEGRLFPREATLLVLLAEINHSDIDMRDASSAPRNSRELAVRNQFFTPRYVVEFLTDNTLGRIWYEMTRGETALKEECRYLVRRPNEVFLQPCEAALESPQQEDLSQEELLRQPVYIPHRPLKDPRDLKMLDPACGSMHFGLYAFDLFERIYEEAWEIEEAQGADALLRSEGLESLRATYEARDVFLRDVPRLIIERNIHGIDIDPRAVQIAGLSLWLRAQKSWQDQKMKPLQRPQIQRSNVVCAEPMPGEDEFLEEFIEAHLSATPEQRLLGQLFRRVVEKMKLAGEAGPLLRIEQEIAGAVAEAKQKWLVSLQVEQRGLFERANATNADEGFWLAVEDDVYSALQEYADQSEYDREYQRRLFSQDAARGFAFINICRTRFDAVVMNPPFGEFSINYRVEAEHSYTAGSSDIIAAFVERSLEIRAAGGLVGAISSRTPFYQTTTSRWRTEIVLPSGVHSFIELGGGVLDSAMVETVMYTIGGCHSNTAIFIISTPETFAVRGLDLLRQSTGWFLVNPAQFGSIDGSPFAYWLSERLFWCLENLPSLEDAGVKVRVGLQSGDDFRFMRTWWEISAFDNGWVPHAKGGENSPYYSDIHLVVNWAVDGAEIKAHPSAVTRSSRYYLSPGLTFSYRTFRFSPALLPPQCITGVAGMGIFSQRHELKFLAAVLNSSVVNELISARLNRRELDSLYQAGVVSPTPFAEFSADARERIAKIGDKQIQIAQARFGFDETSRAFRSPTENLAELPSVREAANLASENSRNASDQILMLFDAVDRLTGSAYGFDQAAVSISNKKGRQLVSRNFLASGPRRTEFVGGVLSFFLGCAFGRWDVQIAAGQKPTPALPNPFAPLPICPPGQLQNEEGLPVTSHDVARMTLQGRWNYPIEIPWNGILVDDPGHSRDVEARIHHVLQVVWNDRWEPIEREGCEILGTRTLRDYYRKPGGFFADHLQRYSKSRRQAPIYWPLSTPSGSYTLWLYYHRLTDQTLYTCVNDFVEPKLKQVAEEAAGLRAMSGRSAADEWELERFSNFEMELKDFRDELLRTAKFWKPNLNDGVQITAAPLWRLFQHKPWQKKLKDTWDKLAVGEYDWAHLAYSIWPDRVRDACRTDRSVAIAHGLEDLYEEKDQPKKRRGKAKANQEEIAKFGLET